MLRNARILRTIAIFLTLNMVFYIFTPLVAYASLTAGPTAPEYTSFEPVDTTEMVNLATGDFTYNIPLLEVPGPEGGYPLSLAYHAGIYNDQEASWVGLGWTLNPGAINRSVKGYADDQFEARRRRRDYNSGDESERLTIGVGITDGLQLSVSSDSEKGLGVGFNVSIGSIKGVDLKLGVNSLSGASLGASRAGGNTSGEYFDPNWAVTSADVSMSISSNFRNSTSLSGSVGIGGGYSVGGTISSGGQFSSAQSIDSPITINQENSRAGIWRITSSGKSFNSKFFNVSKSYTRWYSDESQDVDIVGALRANEAWVTGVHPTTHSFDSFSLTDRNSSDLDLEDNDPEKEQIGSFPSYDAYQVTGQGVTGSIQPYILQNLSLYRQARASGPYVNYSKITDTNKKVNFRYSGDFSNKYKANDASQLNINSGVVSFSNDSFVTDQHGYNSIENHLTGSKHVEWFSNIEVQNGGAKSKGLITPNAYQNHQVSFEGEDISHQIGAFRVTNASGVSYHYAQPVYAYGEQSKNERITDDVNKEIYTQTYNSSPYAYTWLLTGMTGPDYYDANNDGQVNDGDWGYWVKFDYGKWHDSYQWRTPGTGVDLGLTKNIEKFSYGKKQLYYLDAISTRTHTAVFVKSARLDARGVADVRDGVYGAATNHTYAIDNDAWTNWNSEAWNERTYWNRSVSTLKLDRILLFDNNKLPESVSSLRQKSNNSNCSVNANDCSTNYYQDWLALSNHFKDNVIDNLDVTLTSNFIDDAIRVVDFSHDYSLSQGMPNSGPDHSFYQYNTPPGQNPASVVYSQNNGRLTLNKVQFLGKGGAKVMPPIDFEYWNNQNYDKDKHDIWGMYRHGNKVTSKRKVGQGVSAESASNVNAWSLKKVNTSLGSDISIVYEADSYSESVIGDLSKLHVFKFLDQGNNTIRLEFTTDAIDLSVLQVGDLFDLTAISEEIETIDNGFGNVSTTNSFFTKSANNALITAIGGDYIEFVNAGLHHDFFYHDSDLPNSADETEHKGLDGVVKFQKKIPRLGGRIRVKELEVKDLATGEKSVTRMEYTKPGTSITSGVTAYVPDAAEIADDYSVSFYPQQQQDDLLSAAIDYLPKLMGLSPFIPSPGTIYENVTVKSFYDAGDGTLRQKPGSKVYTFQPFEEEFVKVTDMNVQASSVTPFHVKDYKSFVGSLLKLEELDPQGNVLMVKENHFLNQNLNTYDSEIAGLNHQGVISEMFNEKKNVDGVDKYIFSKKEEFPVVNIGSTTTNFKTGAVVTSSIKEFDFYTGVPVKTLSHDSYGNRYLSQKELAYKHYPGMGLKTVNGSNKHMLIQESGSYTYKVDENLNKVAVAGASVSLWDNNIPALGYENVQNANIWREYKAFNWIGKPGVGLRKDGLYPFNSNDFTEFSSWDGLSIASGWQLGAELTLFNKDSKPLEVRDMNGQYASTKLGPNERFVLATSSNARYNEMFFDGFEYEPTANATEAHTGTKSLSGGISVGSSEAVIFSKTLLRESASGDDYLVSDDYRASIWVKPSKTEVNGAESIYHNATLSYSIDGNLVGSVNMEEDMRAGDWYLLNLDILDLPNSYNNITLELKVSGIAIGISYVDDFRFHPLRAEMTSYVYNDWGEVTHIINVNNLFTEYEYDLAGRLKTIHKEKIGYGKVKLSEQSMIYKKSVN